MRPLCLDASILHDTFNSSSLAKITPRNNRKQGWSIMPCQMPTTLTLYRSDSALLVPLLQAKEAIFVPERCE